MKVCTKCNIKKDLLEFNKKSDAKDGLHPSCKECRKLEFKKYYKENKETLLSYQKSYYNENKEYVINREKVRQKENPELSILKEKKRREKRKKYFVEYYNKRRQFDILFKISGNLRNRINKFIKNKSKSTEKITGLSYVKLKEHLENQFFEGMTWDNYGDWHIDHIIPLSSAKTEEEIYKLCHYTNLQPLWAEDNLKKSNKII